MALVTYPIVHQNKSSSSDTAEDHSVAVCNIPTIPLADQENLGYAAH